MVFVLRNNILSEVNPNDVQPSDIPVYTMTDCAVRVQNPADRARGGDPDHPERSIMSPGIYRAPQSSVDSTIRHFDNAAGSNIALWLEGETALCYAGIRRIQGFPMTPQPGLNSPGSMISLIPPRHFDRDGLTRVSPSQEAAYASGSRIDAFGIDGVVRSTFGFRAQAASEALAGGSYNGFEIFPHVAGDGFDEGNRRVAFIVDVRSRALETLVGQRINLPQHLEGDGCVGVTRASQYMSD